MQNGHWLPRIARITSVRRLRPRPRVRREYLVQRRMLDQLMAAHHARNGLADLLESDPPVAEGLHGHFVGGVEHRRHRSAGFSRLARQAERRKTVEVRLFK